MHLLNLVCGYQFVVVVVVVVFFFFLFFFSVEGIRKGYLFCPKIACFQRGNKVFPLKSIGRSIG